MSEQSAGINSIYESAVILRDPMTLDNKGVTMPFFKDLTTLVLIPACMCN